MSLAAVRRWFLGDRFSRFDTIPACDGQTDGRSCYNSIAPRVAVLHWRAMQRMSWKKGIKRSCCVLDSLSKSQQVCLPSASYVGWQRDTARICCWPPCCCAPSPAAAIDRYLLPAGPAAANPPHAAAAVDRWDRQTDSVPLHTPCRILCEQCRNC